MVGSGLPQGLVTFHAVIATEGVHDRILEAMTHVQTAGYVWRRDNYAIGFAVTLRGKVALLFPVLVPGLFNGLRVIGFIHGIAAPIRKAAIIHGRNRKLQCLGAINAEPGSWICFQHGAGPLDGAPGSLAFFEFFLYGEPDFLPGDFHVVVEDAAYFLLEGGIIGEQLGRGNLGLGNLAGSSTSICKSSSRPSSDILISMPFSIRSVSTGISVSSSIVTVLCASAGSRVPCNSCNAHATGPCSPR